MPITEREREEKVKGGGGIENRKGVKKGGQRERVAEGR